MPGKPGLVATRRNCPRAPATGRAEDVLANDRRGFDASTLLEWLVFAVVVVWCVVLLVLI
jgi:predicted nucleic acid-binding Zn ribbon protein